MPDSNANASYEAAFYASDGSHYTIVGDQNGEWTVAVARGVDPFAAATDIIGSRAKDGSVLVQFVFDGTRHAIRVSEPSSNPITAELQEQRQPLLEAIDAELDMQPKLKGEGVTGLWTEYLYDNGHQLV